MELSIRMFQLTTNLEARLGQLKSYLLRIYQLFEMIAKAKFSNGFILSPPKYFLSARLTINRLYPSISSPLRIRGNTRSPTQPPLHPDAEVSTYACDRCTRKCSPNVLRATNRGVKLAATMPWLSVCTLLFEIASVSN